MRIDPVEDNLTSQSETASLCSSTDSLDQQQLQLQLQQQQQPTPVGSSRPGSAAGPPAAYIVTVWVYANMSGLIVVDASGIVETCNHHFTHLMLGYTKAELVGQVPRKITISVLLHFYNNHKRKLILKYVCNSSPPPPLLRH